MSKTHLGDGNTSAFVMPSAAIARALSSISVGSSVAALRNGTQRF